MLVVRQFQREVEEELLVILDAEMSADVGEGSENALEYLIVLASSIVHTASEYKRAWSLAIVGEEVRIISHKGQEVLGQVQHALAEVGKCSATSTAKNRALGQVQYALAKLEGREKGKIEDYLGEITKEYGGSGCILLTSRMDGGPLAALSEISKGWGGALLVRVDPSSFPSGVEDGVKVMKQRREAGKESRSIPSVRGVREITVLKGDTLQNIFAERFWD